MITKPRNDIANIVVGEWEDVCSDIIDDVAFKLIDTIEEALRTYQPVSVKFAGGSGSFIMVFDALDEYVYVIYGDRAGLFAINESVCSLAQELINDINDNLEEWARWGVGNSAEMIEERKKDLTAAIEVLARRLIKEDEDITKELQDGTCPNE